MTASNLVVTDLRREVRFEGRLNLVADPFLAGVMQHGDRRSVATALNVGAPRMTLMLDGAVRSPFRSVVVVVEQLRKNGNPQADEPLLRLARALGFVAYRSEPASVADAELAAAMKEFADVMNARANAGEVVDSPEEARAIVKECDEAIALLAKYRDNTAKRFA